MARCSGDGGSEREAPAVDYVERAEKLAPLIASQAERMEEDRRLSPAVLAALHDAGLFRLLLPKALGGAEVDPPTFARVIETVARTDASTAWCLCQAGGCSMAAAYLRPDVAAEIFGGDPRALLAWGPGPEAHAVAVQGGYRVTGRWSFASGGRHATWLGGYCSIVEPDGTARMRPDGRPAGLTMLFPARRATLVDVWRVTGLRATGSDAYAVDDLFVPEDHAIARDDPSARRDPGLLYCFPIGNLYTSGFAGVALGVARSMLEALLDLARTKTPRGLARPLRESAVVQSEVARAEARLRSARLFLLGSLEEIWRSVERTGSLGLDERMRIRLAGTHAIHEAKSVADVAWDAAGATAIFTDGPFERRFRDIHTVTQQLQGRQAHFETVGRLLLGLEADTTFL